MRAAAAREIQLILQKQRGLRTRVQRGAKRVVQRINYGKLQPCRVNGCQHQTREPIVAAQHARQHAREGAGRQRGQAPARAPDMRRQAGLLPQGQKRQPGPQSRQQPQSASRPGGPVKMRGSVWETGGARAAVPDPPARTRSPRAPTGPERAPAAPSGTPARTPLLPHETVRAPSRSHDKPRWSGLRRRSA